MLRGEDFQDALVNEAALPGPDPDRLAGRSRTSSWTRLRN